MTPSDIEKIILDIENAHLEFKSARGQFNTDELINYCAALSNEGGGKLLLGIAEDKSNQCREIVGTKAFEGTWNTLSRLILEQTHVRVEVEEVQHDKGRVLVFIVPSHPKHTPIRAHKIYWMRAGESLSPMDEESLRKIFAEDDDDFSSHAISNFSMRDLDDDAMQNLKRRWAQKSGKKEYLDFSYEKLLHSLGLITDEGLTYAALVLVGKSAALQKLLPCAEIILEWRSEAHKINHDYRTTWREPFFKIYDRIWDAINARNLRIPFQEGFIQREIFAYSEIPLREAILNAVTHRDYTIASESIFVNTSPAEIVIISPGGFPQGITIENILRKHSWRNRLIAEVLEKAGLVERSGQGMDQIFKITIQEGKGAPDLSESDIFSVKLKIPAKVKDKKFILFLEKIVAEQGIALSSEEIFELEKIREMKKNEGLEHKAKFLKLGLIEKIGRGRGSQYILAHKYYEYAGKPGVHTRLTGTTRDEKKILILKHLKKQAGYKRDFHDVFPDLSSSDIHNLLQELKREKKIEHLGTRRGGYWQLTNNN